MGVKLCITAGCMQPTAGSRCQRCEREYQQQRNADPKRKAYADPAYRAVPLDGQCACCGSVRDLTRDHVDPLSVRPASRGQVWVQLMCRSCNGSKGGRAMADQRCPQHGGVILDGGSAR